MQKDTSFNLASEARKIRKQYPAASLVEWFPNTKVAVTKDVVYCTVGDRDLHLDVFTPGTVTQKRNIGILIVHGGGWRSGDRSMHYPLADRLAKAGFTCFPVEYRLSTEALYPAGQDDVKSAIRWVRFNAGRWKLEKLVILGHSAGGELAAMMGATNTMSAFEGKGCASDRPSTVDAVVDIDGILAFVHPESGEGDDRQKVSAATQWFGVGKDENENLWRYASPLSHVGSHAPPFLFINSGVSRMHAGRDDFVRMLEESGIGASVRTFSDAPHSFCFFEPWFSPMVDEITAFLLRTFPGT